MAETLLAAQQNGFALSVTDLLISLSLAALVGGIVVLVYRVTHRGLNYERSFLVSLLLIAPIVAVVMMLIGTNLALSLGMVGALSIIRFRTVIKDTRDMVYLFWAISIGLGCGTYNWIPVLVSAGFIAAVMILLHLLHYGRAVHSDYVLVVAGDRSAPLEAIRPIVSEFAARSEMRSMDANDSGWELVLELRIPTTEEPDGARLLEQIRSLDRVRSVSLLAPQLALPV